MCLSWGSVSWQIKILKGFTKGYTKMVAELKQIGDMPLFEGKRPISFAGYQYMTIQALKQERDFTSATFAHAFLILCWNLMARSVSVGQLMFSHLSWDNDSLIITIPRHKGDQEGRYSYPRHVFANPLNPSTCPVLSLSKAQSMNPLSYLTRHTCVGHGDP